MGLAPGSRVGAYEIVAPLGAGGMGEVYRGRDVKLGREVAIKILPEHFANDAERVARFEREAKTLATLNHPHIAQIYGFEQSGSASALAMELVDGEDLSARIARGPMPLDEALAIAKQIADALDAAHGQGIIHRDLKPANVKIKDDGTVKVLDFGLAKAGASGASGASGATITSPAVSMPGVILGTAAYMAPEQAKGRPVDKRADIWAFGCVLYEMVTGRRAFGGEDVSETIASILKTDPDWQDVPPSITPLLESCLQKDSRKRLRDIGDAAFLLASRPRNPAPARSSSSFAWPVAALAAVAAAALAVVHFREQPPAAPEPTMFGLAAPENTDLADSYLSLSRDGRRLAFTARDRDGRTRIWVRDFATTTVRALPGSEGARSPVLAPDGNTMAFAIDRRLYKVRLDGGTPQVLCEVEHNAGVGSWNDGGTIVFGSRLGGPIYKVSATGGRAAPITALDQTRVENFHAIPVFLRDGRRFLYFRSSLNRRDRGLYVGSIDLPPDRQSMERLVTTEHGPGYYAPAAGPDRVLYMLERNLVSQQLNETATGFVGEPALEASRIASAGSIASFSVAASGTLVYRHGANVPPGENELTWFDRTGQVLGAAAERGGYGAMSLSPDGRRIAVSMTTTAGQPPDLWTIDVERRLNTRFTADGATDQFPIWSADGSHIIFRSNRAGRFDLYEKNATGLEPERLLLQSPLDKIPGSESADGRFLLFDATPPEGGSDIWVLTRGATPEASALIATAFSELQAAFSPDGRLIAYVSDESGRPEVHVRTFTPPGQPSPAGAGQWRISNNGGTRPRWRADGKELFYRADSSIMSAAIDYAGGRFTPASAVQLFDSASIFTNAWDVSPDGQRFLLGMSPNAPSSEPITVVLNWRPGRQQAQ